MPWHSQAHLVIKYSSYSFYLESFPNYLGGYKLHLRSWSILGLH